MHEIAKQFVDAAGDGYSGISTIFGEYTYATGVPMVTTEEGQYVSNIASEEFIKAAQYMNEAYKVIGTPATILRMLETLKVSPPEGYSKEDVESFLNTYNTNSSINNNLDAKPNIVVIVNESFCDYYNVYKDSTSDINPIQDFLDISNGENAISGVLYSSAFGGQTSNVEYEFLTQNSIRLLTPGSYVFQQYIIKSVDYSLANYLKNQGYTTKALHLLYATGYRRNACIAGSIRDCDRNGFSQHCCH